MSVVDFDEDRVIQRERISYDRESGPIMNTILRRLGFASAERFMAADHDDGPKSVNIVSFEDKDIPVRDKLVEAFISALDAVEIPALLTPSKDVLRDNGVVTDNVTISTETFEGSDFHYPHQFRVAVLGNPGPTYNHGWASASQKMLELVKAVDNHLEARGFKDPTPGATFK